MPAEVFTVQLRVIYRSPNYFSDMISRQTGHTASEHIRSKVIGLAKERLLSSDKTMSQIAYELGFQYPQHLSRMFKTGRRADSE